MSVAQRGFVENSSSTILIACRHVRLRCCIVCSSRSTNCSADISRQLRRYKVLQKTQSKVQPREDSMARQELIGDENYAVWVYDNGGSNLVEPRDWLRVLESLPRIASNAVSLKGLSWSDGPYIAVMDRHPDYFKEYTKNAQSRSDQ